METIDITVGAVWHFLNENDIIYGVVIISVESELKLIQLAPPLLILKIAKDTL